MLVQMPIIFGLFALLRDPLQYMGTNAKMMFAVHESFLWMPRVVQGLALGEIAAIETKEGIFVRANLFARFLSSKIYGKVLLDMTLTEGASVDSLASGQEIAKNVLDAIVDREPVEIFVRPLSAKVDSYVLIRNSGRTSSAALRGARSARRLVQVKRLPFAEILSLFANGKPKSGFSEKSASSVPELRAPAISASAASAAF